MTQPIQEPSSARESSGLAWGERQLARRPASPSACPCPIDSALANDSQEDFTAVANNSLTTVTFAQSSVAAGSSAFTVFTHSQTPIKLHLNGWYSFYLDFSWSGGGFTDVRLYELVMNVTADNDSASMTTTDGIGVEASSPYQSETRGHWSPLYFRPEVYGLVTVKVKVKQNSGISQDVTGVTLTSIYLGPDLDPSRFPPF